MIVPAAVDRADLDPATAGPAPTGIGQARDRVGGAEVPWYLTFSEIVLTLRKRPLLALMPAVLSVACAVAILALTPPHYTATTAILIDPQKLQVVKDELSPTGQTSDASLLLVDSQMLVLSSDDVLRRVVDAFALDRDPEFIRGSALGRILSTILGPLAGAGGPRVDPRLLALRVLRERLTVHRVDRSFVLSLGVTSSSRDRATQLAQGVADTYLAVEGENRTGMARRAGAEISARLGALQTAVRDAENEAQRFRTANSLVGTRTQLVSEQQLGQVGEQLGAARAQAAEQRARLNQIQAVVKAGGQLDALPEVLQSPTITQLRTQLAAAERTMAESATRLGERHPAMIAARDQVRGARAQLDAEVSRIAASVRDQVRSAQANVAELSGVLDKGKAEANSVGDAMVHLRELERQADARRSVYEAFLVRSRELAEQQQLATSASRVISPATLPDRRQGPSSAMVLAAALLAGLGLGVGTALLADQIGGRTRTSRRLRQRTGLDVAGVVPRPGPAAQPANAAALVANDPQDRAVARLRQHLRRLPDSGPGQVVLVTAADRVSGKTPLALKLAVIAAGDNERVLLVDADPDSRLSRDFGIAVLPVQTRIDDGRAAPAEARVMHAPNLRFLSLGNGSSRADVRAAADMIQARAEAYDLIVINAGLLGGDLLTERLTNHPRVSAVLVAASAARSTAAPITRALPLIDPERTTLAVLTDAAV